jgi:hypothetical protein
MVAVLVVSEKTLEIPGVGVSPPLAVSGGLGGLRPPIDRFLAISGSIGLGERVAGAPRTGFLTIASFF